MKRLLHSLSARALGLGISAGISLLIFLILWGVSASLAGGLESQNMAERWSGEKDVAQVSCFFSTKASVTEDTIESFEHGLDSALQMASITQESENPGARLWVDAYSAQGTLALTSSKTTVSADAIGIGGDFFLFHPMDLVSGSFFSGNDLMQDYCVIDRETAWQLFGSSDVAGQMVTIGSVPHMVVGVVERERGRLTEAAGLDGSIVYVSYEALCRYGSGGDINHYEIVMPNPVTGFAADQVRQSMGVDGAEIEIVENSRRFSLQNRLKLLTQFGVRSMNGKAIIYPYWENVARGYEDILALLTLGMCVFLLYPAGVLAVWLILRWRRKTWTVKSVFSALQDKWQRRGARRKRKRGGTPDQPKKASKKKKRENTNQ